MQEADFVESLKVIAWNKRCLSYIGIWPAKVHDPIFLMTIVYITLHCSLTYRGLIENIRDIDYVFANLAESVCITLVILKILACRMNKASITEVLTEIEPDFVAANYKNAREKNAFLAYNKFTFKFVKITTILMSVVTVLYFVKEFLITLEIAMTNSSNPEYQLPYKTYPIIQPRDWVTYACLCFYQAFTVPIVICGSVGFDCLIIILALHLSSQFAVLTCRVNETLKTSNNFHREIKELVLRHQHLIRLADILEDRFNIVILEHLLGTVFNLCISGYQTLAFSADGNSTKLITFSGYATYVLATLFAYCYIGECLITESTEFGESFYHNEWYNLSLTNLTVVRICIMRARNPLLLTSGKFCALSYYTFTDVLKTSMGYLSVIRTLQ